MPTLAGISVFMVGRHKVGVTRFADDDAETRIVALRVVLDGEEIAMWPGEWREDDSEAWTKPPWPASNSMAECPGSTPSRAVCCVPGRVQ